MDSSSEKSSTKPAQLAVPWHRSIVLRAAAIAAGVLLLGYGVSVFIGMQSIDAISRLAHDQEIEGALSAQLDQIKDVQDLRQLIIAERINHGLRDLKTQQPTDLEQVRALVIAAVAGFDIDSKELQIEALTTKPDTEQANWTGRSRLEVLNYGITFPKGNLYKTFKDSEALVQRYQLVGSELDSNIRPTLIKANTVVLLVGFFVLILAFFYMAKVFRQSVVDVLDGFAKWSGEDFSFRFTKHYQGELGLITTQFNHMAKDIEANRQKTMYLEKIASWQVIARKLAHEIKNPLTPIQMMVSQLHRRYNGEDPEFRKLLDDAQTIISEEVAGLRRMVDNFSKFARLPEPAFERTDLVKVAKHVLEMQRATFQQHEFAYDGNLTEAHAWADDGLLKQVLINLTKNAAEACTEPAKISIGLDDAGKDYLMRVRDTGPGIPEEIRQKIFEAYFTTKHTGPSPGMGLGLAICQKIILDHKGDITVDSKKGDTVFTIRIPKNQKGT